MLDSERQYDELIAALTKVLDREPRNVIALNNRGVALWELGHIDRALEDLSDAIQIDANAAVPLMNGETF